MKNINNKGISLVLAMGLVVLISLLAITILEYIIPFSRSTKGIENSSNSYYQTVGAIEDAMWFISQNNLGDENTTSLTSSAVGNSYTIIANGSELPPLGEGNSEYDTNWNIIKSGTPIQLEVGNGKISNFNNVIFNFRVPNLDNNSTTNETLSGGDIINWQLSSSINTLNNNGEFIKASDICSSNETTTSCNIDFTSSSFNDGIDLNGNPYTFNYFFRTIENCDDKINLVSCTLKLSIINKLELTNGTPIPYLEWKADFDESNTLGESIPLRYTKIEAKGKSYSFMKSLDVKIPQQTTIEAFDFTIFQ